MKQKKKKTGSYNSQEIAPADGNIVLLTNMFIVKSLNAWQRRADLPDIELIPF